MSSYPTEQTQDGTPSTLPRTMAEYRFPHDKLSTRLSQAGKTPLVLVACGSFSPTTMLHLRMFEMASDFVRFNTQFELVGAYLSPVSDAYQKSGLAPAYHRVNMCAAAVRTSWIMVDPFETLNCDENGEPKYVPTANVLKHFDHEINEVLGGIEDVDGQRKKARIALLAGADLVMSMGEPGLWSPTDLDIILGNYGAFIIERAGTDVDEALTALRQYEENIWIIPQLIQNDVSSTKIRLFLKKDLSVRYLIPDPVVEYIEQHGLFHDPKHGEKDKAASDSTTGSSSEKPQIDNSKG